MPRPARVPATRIALAVLLLGAPAAAAQAEASAGDAEPVLLVDVLDNGDFAAPRVQPGPGEQPRIPWWIERAEEPLEVDLLEGEPGLWTDVGELVQQPLPAYAPLLDRLVVRGRVGGWGLVTVIDGLGGLVPLSVQGIRGGMEPFELTGADLAQVLGRAPRPRLVLQLAADPHATSSQRRARWEGVEVLVALPCPSEDALRAEILAWLRGFFVTWQARALDDAGARETAFLSRLFDAATGEPIGAPLASAHPLNPVFTDLLAPALRAAPDEPGWPEALARYLDDLLELGLHPDTGLPCAWDPVADAPLGAEPVQIARPLRFLIDVAERGPESHAAAARAAALRIGEHVLAAGVAPDGTVAPSYRPADGARFFDTPPIRRLDVPAQLARLGALTGDERYARVAHEALLEVELTHYWPGSWDSIDPGFDDVFGHYAERGVTIWRALPEHAAGRAARRLVLSGYETYAPLWRDALRLGGNVAADQVRCWRILADVAELVPEERERIEGLLDLAVRSHFKGEQVGSGAWIDTTVVGFGPRQLPVGDTGGVPQNLLEGLAVAYGRAPSLRTDETRARFTAVMRAALAAFGAEHGLIEGGRRTAGANPATGSVRFAIGLVEMLDALSR